MFIFAFLLSYNLSMVSSTSLHFSRLGCTKESVKQHKWDQKDMAFEFQNYKTAQAAKEALSRLLPPGVSKEVIIERMQSTGATVYELQGNILPVRFVESSLTMVHVVWSLAFYLNKDMKLDKIEVRRGLTGP